jgi:hypothetical protein
MLDPEESEDEEDDDIVGEDEEKFLPTALEETDAEDQTQTDPHPDFDWDIYFTYDGIAPSVTMEDPEGIIRLIKINMGQGAVTVIGEPLFMYNDYLEDGELNARLSWDLTGASSDGDNPGVRFIRGKKAVKSLFGKLADRGNFLPLGLSALILVVAGFWMAVPSFGLLFREKEQPARSIGERFLAETRFLKKYHSLETYTEIYLREIKAKNRGPHPELESIENVLKKGKGLRYNDIIRSLKICQAIMERL